jgi:class 3 adenylate cyclase/tetratricopeptide (TPR) repeat protein
MATPLPRKLTAILYADVAGYSRLTAQDEDGTHRRLASALDTIAAMVSALRGRVVHYAGDAVLADFATVTDALTCSVLIQRSLQERNSAVAEEQRLHFRIGVNLGEVIDDRGDIYGDGVNIAARLEALAEPGGICISETVRTAVGKRVPVEFEDLGLCEVKNIPEPVHAWQVRDGGLEAADKGGREGVVLLAHARAYELLMGEGSEADARAALDRCRALVVSMMESSRGRMVETPGDTIAAVFDDPAGCIDCALEARAAITDANAALPQAERVHYRFGVAFGKLVVGRDGFSGDAVDRAARLITAAGSDEIHLDDDVLARLPEKTELSLVELEPGDHALVSNESPEASRGLPAQLDALDIPLPDKPSIVLLPFKCLGDDPQGAALADGLRLDIQNALVKSSGLLLIAAGTANAFRDSAGAQAATHLGARHVLEGTVQRAGERVRVGVELTDTQASTIVWSERYDRTLDDTFALQDEIAEHVVTMLDVKLSSGEQARIWRKCLSDTKARDHFYSGMHEFFQMNAESNARARASFERVAALAPESPMGPTWAALCWWFEATRNWSDDPHAARRRAGEWAERAVQSEDADGQAHTVLGNVRLLEGRFDEALAIARDAVKIRPGCTNANGFLANVLLHCGECEDAIVHAKRAIRLSPVYPPWFLEILAAAYRDAGKIGFAISVSREALRIVPKSINARALLAGALVRGASPAEARSVGGQIVELDPDFSSTRYAEALPYRDRAVVARTVDDLRMSGLPD